MRIHHKPAHFSSSSQGQFGGAAIEFALIFPILIALIMGILEFGLILHMKNVLANASREGARNAIIMVLGRDSTSVETAAENSVNTFLTNSGWEHGEGSDITIEITDQDGNTPVPAASGQSVRVSVTRTYTYLILPILNSLPFLDTNIPNTIGLTSTTTMVLE
ncbi:MAG: TadE/TadG family type IV pilus assembly protein [Nitrospirae bacterium]|nr:TadE/TadG family type IV pilus assembly protein [Nitrospirota bacterium]